MVVVLSPDVVDCKFIFCSFAVDAEFEDVVVIVSKYTWLDNWGVGENDDNVDDVDEDDVGATTTVDIVSAVAVVAIVLAAKINNKKKNNK